MKCESVNNVSVSDSDEITVDFRLSYEQRKFIQKFYSQHGNVAELRRQFSREIQTDPLMSFTIVKIIGKLEVDGTVQNVEKKSRKYWSSTYPAKIFVES